jgi:aryl-alcohol dehydrogenase-like predicted oxidoreductase
LYDEIGLGLTTWSPLSSGALTGKYLDKMPEGSRLTMKSMAWLAEEVLQEKRKKQVQGLVNMAKEIGSTPAALAIAWCAKNPHVSSVITGASREEQIHDNMKALEILPKLSKDVMTKLNEVFPVNS